MSLVASAVMIPERIAPVAAVDHWYKAAQRHLCITAKTLTVASSQKY